jgi:hypothetical protein
MKSILYALSSICLVLNLAEISQAKEWRGIIPLRSTRADVEKLLGKPFLDDAAPPYAKTYKTENETVHILYSTGLCNIKPNHGWNLPPNTVIYIDVSPHNLKIADLKLNLRKFKKLRNPRYKDLIHYRNKAEGFDITIDRYDTRVIALNYYPESKYNYLRGRGVFHRPKTSSMMFQVDVP